MKTSNYFLLSLLVLFLGGIFMIANYAHAKTKIKVKTVENPKVATTNINLPSFSVVVAEEGASFKLVNGGGGSRNVINFDVALINTVYAPLYEVRNDTLFVKKNPNVSLLVSKASVLIQCQEIKSFIAKPKSDVEVTNQFPENAQEYKLDDSKLMFWGGRWQGNNPESMNYAKIKLMAINSEIKFDCVGTLINLELDLNASHFKLLGVGGGRNVFNEITGSIKNDSRVDFIHENLIRKIDIKGDETSSFYRK